MKAERIEQILLIHLLATAILAVMAFGTVESWSLVIFEINALVMAVMMGLLQLVDDDFQWRRLRFSLPLWALLIWGLIQLAPLAAGGSVAAPPESLSLAQLRLPTISKDPQSTREVVARLLALAIYFSVALQVFRRTAARRLAVRVLAVFGLAISFLAIAQRLTWNGRLYWVRPISIYVAPFGPYGNYNHFAGLVELLLPLSLAMILFARIKTKDKLIHIGSSAMLIAAVVLSMSRGGILSIVVQTLFFGTVLIFLRRRIALQVSYRWVVSLLILLVAGTILAALSVGQESLLKRIGSIQEGSSEFSVVTRIEYLKASWQMFLDHPLTGVGFGAFSAVYPSYGSSSSRYERVEQVHNDYLQLLTDAGIIGGLVLIVTVVWILKVLLSYWRRILTYRSEERAVIVGSFISIVGLAVHSLFDFNLQLAANALLFVIVLAFLFSLSTESIEH